LSSDDVLALYNKTYDNPIIKIDNYNFMNPLKTDPFTYIPTLPSWRVDKIDGIGIIISRADSPFYPSSNTNLPSGYTGDYEQTFSLQSNDNATNTTTNISQELFITPAKYTLPSWDVDLQPAGIVISREGSPFYPTSNTNLPSGYTGDFEQTFSFQAPSGNTNISQQLFIQSGNYTLSFWAGARGDGNYASSNVFSIYLGETLLVENVSPSPANWTNYTYTYNALSSGNVILRILIKNPANADSTLNIANFSII
jgi:hypothetical protein